MMRAVDIGRALPVPIGAGRVPDRLASRASSRGVFSLFNWPGGNRRPVFFAVARRCSAATRAGDRRMATSFGAGPVAGGGEAAG